MERRLVDLIDQTTLIYTDYDNNNTPSKKIISYNKCMVLITEAKKLIEEIKIEVNDVDKNIQPTTKQMNRLNTLIELLQISNLNVNELMQIIEELLVMKNNIPTTVTIIDNVEKEVLYDEYEL